MIPPPPVGFTVVNEASDPYASIKAQQAAKYPTKAEGGS